MDQEVTSVYQFSILLLISCILYILISSLYNYYTFECREPSVVYKFVPRTFEQEQREPIKASVFFNRMFQDAPVNEYGISLALKSQRNLSGDVLRP